MQTRRIGDRTVSAIGLGTMPLSRPHHATGTLPDRRQAIETVHAALDAGVTFIDCADCYAPDEGPFGHNEDAGRRGAPPGRQPRRPGRHQGRHPARRRGLADLRPTGLPPRGGLRLAQPPRRGLDRALPAPPARPGGAVRRDDRCVQGPVRRGRGAAGRPLERRPRPDPRGARHPRRRAGQRAEPAVPVVPHQRARARPLRRARPGVPAVEPAGGHEQGARPRRGRSARSRRSPRRTTSARTRSRSPGCSPSRPTWSRSPAPAGPRRSGTAPRPCTSSSATRSSGRWTPGSPELSPGRRARSSRRATPGPHLRGRCSPARPGRSPRGRGTPRGG